MVRKVSAVGAAELLSSAVCMTTDDYDVMYAWKSKNAFALVNADSKTCPQRYRAFKLGTFPRT
jgi:hypothetical protein